MREDFDAALARCDATILVHRGEAAAGPITGTAQAMQVSIRTLAHGVDSARPVYAFAGIGAPEKLIAGLRAAGLDVVGARGFPDHHPYRPDEIEALKKRALLLGAQLVTTQKDFVRLEADLRDGIVAVDVEVCWQDETRLEQMLRQVFDAA
jgi:tetraacyldisaccharide 4'-kinase